MDTGYSEGSVLSRLFGRRRKFCGAIYLVPTSFYILGPGGANWATNPNTYSRFWDLGHSE